MNPTQPGEAATPRTDGFEIVVAGESPVLGNRYRAWSDFARQLERELAVLEAQHKAALTCIAKKDEALRFCRDQRINLSGLSDDSEPVLGVDALHEIDNALSLTIPGVADKLAEAEKDAERLAEALEHEAHAEMGGLTDVGWAAIDAHRSTHPKP